jgi:DNA polymerase-3 subunit gamma/tau
MIPHEAEHTAMSYQVLARKWRPRRFADLVGQTHVTRALINALDHDRLHHAFLFTGTRGVGKTTIARILAKSLNCETGVSSQPCGSCTTCREVDEGRFIDLIEVDAASRTKVDDTRELLDNVQYAPTRGRYKVYLIDEVHMLSGHSFNALLKTLEEPPPHVKFLLATTDPQKLPVTVLSRCLQFHLKRISPELIQGQLEKILTAEGIDIDRTALSLLARSADGSLRDALSLLDQAIAFGGGQVSEAEVRDMLGTIDNSIIDGLLDALANGDAAATLTVIADAHERNADPDQVLDELLRALHEVALRQVVPSTGGGDTDEDPAVRRMADSLVPEDVQLFYQIGLIGRRDLALAPDPQTGLEMVLLRMLAFRPATPGSEQPRPTSTPAARPAGTTARAGTPAARPTTVSVTPSHVEASPVARPAETAAPWGEIVAQLGLSGMARELLQHTVLKELAGERIILVIEPGYANLISKEREQMVRDALSKHYGRTLSLQIESGRPEVETPAREKQRVQAELQQQATEVILNDPHVRALQENFGAKVNTASIRPKE